MDNDIFKRNVDNFIFARDAAKDFALFGLKSMIYINAGALVALPAFIQVFNFETVPLLIFCAAAAFSIRLIFSFSSIFWAYQGYIDDLKNAKSAIDKKTLKTKKWKRDLAMGFSVCALLSFITGTVLFISALLI
jgi:hypothetical protein